MILVIFINTVDLNYIVMICKWIYIYNQMAVYSVNRKANLDVDLKIIWF